MKNTEKIYIGKGSQVKDFDLFNITINLTEAIAHAYVAKNGDKLLKFSFTKTKVADNFGRTHTAYIAVQKNEAAEVKEPETVPATKPKKTRAPKKIDPSFANH